MKVFLPEKFHYAWLILAACFALYGGTMGIGYNCNGLFNVAITSEYGWDISQFAISTVCLGLTSALTLNIVDKVLSKFNLKAVLALSLVIYAVTLSLKAVCSQLWQFYLLYAMNGVASAFLFYVPVPMLLNNWFSKKGGFALGIAMLSSGLAGTVMNPVLSALIQNNGWRSAAVINGMVSALFSLPLVLMFVCRRPSDMGLLPYGAEEKNGGSESKYNGQEAAVAHASVLKGEGQTEKDTKKKLALSCLLVLIVVILSMIPQQLSHFASVNGMSASTGALFVSVAMCGNMISKLLMGGAVDKFGAVKTFTAAFLLVTAAFLILAFYASVSELILYGAAFLTGITAANNVIVMPTVVRSFSTDDNYSYYMSKNSVFNMIGIALGTYVCSLIYDLAGSYTVEFLLYAVVNLLCLGIVLYILRK